MTKIAILDDYNHVALKMADWSKLQKRCQVDVIDYPLEIPDQAAQVLKSYDVLCHLRERTPMPRALVEQLPNIKMMTITGQAHRTMDLDAVSERKIPVSCSSTPPKGISSGHGTPELTFGLMLSCIRKIAFEDNRLRQGHWQSTIGICLNGRTLGIVGLGKIGQRVAHIAQAFGMSVIAWSPNLTEERASAAGITKVDKRELFAQSDIVTLHMVLSDRSAGIVGPDEFAAMKPDAYLINTSRGPLINESALLDVLQDKKIAGAGLDVYWSEPLDPTHPLLALDNVTLTPHLGYVVEESFRAFYRDTVEAIEGWLDGEPVRVVNPEVL